jgi:hypothetical protein
MSHLTAGQDRYVFMRCMLEDEKPDLATVNVKYTDELNGGISQTVNGRAQVRFVRDPEAVEKSARADVVTQKELLLTAVAKDEALADADAGHYQAAAQKLSAKAKTLENQAQNAPAGMQLQLRDEINNLRNRSSELQQDQYAPSTRKALQNESWTYRNSKSQ